MNLARQLVLLAGLLAGVSIASLAGAQSNCLEVKHESGKTYLRNSCDVDITVHWTDKKRCSTGCIKRISGFSRVGVTLWHGHTTYGVCWGDEMPFDIGEKYQCSKL